MTAPTSPASLDATTHWQVSAVLARYAHIVDNQAWEQLPLVFTDDAVLDAQYLTARGLPEIQTYLDSFGPWRSHHTINTIAEHTGDATRIKAWSRLLVVEAEGTSIPGDYLDHLVLTSAGWRIRSRRISLRNRLDEAPNGEPWRRQTFADWNHEPAGVSSGSVAAGE